MWIAIWWQIIMPWHKRIGVLPVENIHWAGPRQTLPPIYNTLSENQAPRNRFSIII
uniref:Uncharacterized protein n=1 Tax=Arundo donax TaxID=35708 RepID=A0A0A9AA42_ARUDO